MQTSLAAWFGSSFTAQNQTRIRVTCKTADDVYKALQQNSALGVQQGMRVGYATYAVIAAIKGRDDYLRLALKGFESVTPDKINKDYLLLDTIAEQQVRHLANRFWMRLEGRRAPTEGYSQFLDEKRQPDASLEGLLDGV